MSITENEYLSPVKIRHFKMIEDYKTLMEMPYATQKIVFETLQKKYSEHYQSFDSVKQTFARLKKIHPEKFL